MATCLICGAAHAACGPSTVTTVVPIDGRVTPRKDTNMGALKRYEVDVEGRKGRVTRTTLLLSDEDAERQGLLQPSNGLPGNKADTPPNTAAEADVKKPRFGRK